MTLKNQVIWRLTLITSSEKLTFYITNHKHNSLADDIKYSLDSDILCK